jgi:transcriptional regulator with XRE-family HTH domain
MPDETEATCELWEAEVPGPLPHSRLYHLDPVGTGSPMVESLTSYVMRLAEEHSVSPHVLMCQEILPLLNRSYLYQEGRPVHDILGGFWPQSAVLNGVTPLAKDFVQLLSQLTARDDLYCLTMLPWREVISPTRLFRRTRAWCPRCYEEWRETNQIIYGPLLWQFSIVNTCPLHDRQLEWLCPNPTCMRQQSPIHPRGHPGYCGWCRRWLGSSSSNNAPRLTARTVEERARQQWVCETMGDLLSAVSNPAVKVQQDKFAAMISFYIDRVANGKISTFAHLLQVSIASVWKWQHGQDIPQLATLLKICSRLGISPLCLLTGIWQEIILLPGESEREKSKPSEGSEKRPQRRTRRQLRTALKKVLQSEEEPPPSMREMSRRLGYDAGYLSRIFPDLCRAISTRYMAYQSRRGAERLERRSQKVQEAVQSLHAQGLYPSCKRVEDLLGSPGMLMESEVRAIWKKTMQQLGLKSTRYR